MAELLSVADLEAAKKQDTFHSEVITGKAGGVAGGADIDYSTNAVTGQVQKTLPKLLADIDWSYVGLFADGVEFTKRSDFAVDAVGIQWVYVGVYPFTATAGTVPSEPLYQVVHVRDHNSFSNLNSAGGHDAIYDRKFQDVSAMLSYTGHVVGRLYCSGSTTWECLNSPVLSISDMSPLNDLFITDFGANADGTDSLLAINSALSVNGYAYVPFGNFYSSAIPTEYNGLYGAGNITGAEVILSPTPQSSGKQILKSYRERTFGRYESAVGQSITINSGSGQTKNNTQLTGTDAQGLTTYLGRDHCSQYISASSFIPDVLSASTTYTANTITNSSISTLEVNIGMIVDTLHADPYTSIITGISGNTITVDTWYLRSTGLAATPTDGTGAIINPNNKIFGQNIIVNATGNGTTTGAKAAAGIELSVLTGVQASAVTGTVGIDMAILQGSFIELGYTIRGKRKHSFWSNNAGGNSEIAFRSTGDARGLQTEDCTIPIECITSGASKFSVNSNGDITHSGSYKQANTSVTSPSRTVTTSFQTITTIVAPQQGGEALITGFNTSGGAQGVWKVLFRSGLVSVLAGSSDGTGLGVSFQMSGNDLQVKTTSGTLQMNAQVTKL